MEKVLDLAKYVTYDKKIIKVKKLTIVYENFIASWITGQIALGRWLIKIFLRSSCCGTIVSFGKIAGIKNFVNLVISILQIGFLH